MTTALPLLLAGPALKKSGIRLATIVHGLDVTNPNPAYQLAVRRLCQLLDVVMPISRATGEELVARGLPREKVHVVPNAVDLDRFEEPARPNPAGFPKTRSSSSHGDTQPLQNLKPWGHAAPPKPELFQIPTDPNAHFVGAPQTRERGEEKVRVWVRRWLKRLGF